MRRALVAATTALRLAPPSYLAGFTFFLAQENYSTSAPCAHSSPSPVINT
jgi:hypothetical protein